MKYNLDNREEREAATGLFFQLKAKRCLVEIKEIKPKRSLNQNSYLHLLLGAFGNHFGYTLEEAKLIYKELNKGIYEYEKKNRTFYRSSADLDKTEMTKSIDVFRQKSADAGFPLPTAENQDWLRQIGNDIERNGYL